MDENPLSQNFHVANAGLVINRIEKFENGCFFFIRRAAIVTFRQKRPWLVFRSAHGSPLHKENFCTTPCDNMPSDAAQPQIRYCRDPPIDRFERPACHYHAGPNELKRPGDKWEEVICPKCGVRFEIPQKGKPYSTS
jgi:hypothetical protein